MRIWKFRVERWQFTLVLFGLLIALFLVQAAVVCLLVMIAVWLSTLVAPVLAGLIVAVAALAVAGLIAWTAIGKLKQLSDLPGGVET